MTTNVAACKALIDSQAAKGLNKYTVPLEKSDASLSHLARHGAEEMADAMAYFVALEAKAKALEAENGRLTLALQLVRDSALTRDEARDIAATALNKPVS